MNTRRMFINYLNPPYEIDDYDNDDFEIDDFEKNLFESVYFNEITSDGEDHKQYMYYDDNLTDPIEMYCSNEYCLMTEPNDKSLQIFDLRLQPSLPLLSPSLQPRPVYLKPSPISEYRSPSRSPSRSTQIKNI